MERYTLLVVSRTQSLAKKLREALDAERHLIRWVPNTRQALKLDLWPSLVLLDLPPSGGSRSAMRLKQRFNAPLVVLARRDGPAPEESDALLSCAFRLQEMADLIESLLIDHAPRTIQASGMSLDTELRRLQLNGAVHQLRPIGCRLLAVLMGRAGTAVPREELFRRVWHTEDGDNTRALDVHIASLRRQLEEDPRHPQLILTERGVGYRLQPPG